MTGWILRKTTAHCTESGQCAVHVLIPQQLVMLQGWGQYHWPQVISWTYLSVAATAAIL